MPLEVRCLGDVRRCGRLPYAACVACVAATAEV